MEEWKPGSKTKSAIYCITDGTMIYVGSTQNMMARMRKHRIDKDIVDNKLYRYWREHDMKVFIIIEECNRRMEENIILALDDNLALNSRRYRRENLTDYLRSPLNDDKERIERRRRSRASWVFRHKDINYLHMIMI